MRIQKIVICGSVGSGKTTAAKMLSKMMGIPWFSGDSICYGHAVGAVSSESGRFKRTPQEQTDIMEGILGYPAWIVEGVYRPAQEALFAHADRIVFLSVPYKKRCFRIVLRWVKQRLRIETADYRPTLSMLRMMFHWNRAYETEIAQIQASLMKYAEKIRYSADADEILSWIGEEETV